MAFLDQAINAADLPEAQAEGDFSPLPEGKYQATVVTAELKQTKAGTGQYIDIQWSITGPSHANRRIFDMVNIKNPSQVAEDIGRRQLGGLLRVAGIPVIRDTDQLVGVAATITLKIRKQAGYKDSNSVTRYEPIAAGSPAHIPQAQPRPPMPAQQKPVQAPAPASQKSSGAPPWAVKKSVVAQTEPPADMDIPF